MSNTKKSSTKTALAQPSSTLATIPAAEAVDRFRQLHGWVGIIPAAAEARVEAQLSRLERLFIEKNYTVRDLITHQATVLSHVTGVLPNAVTQVQRTQTAEDLHTTRNLLVAVAAIGADSIGVDSAATSPACVYGHSVKLARRSLHVRRPLSDDEVVLCRVAAHLALRRDPLNHTALVYTLTEAGQTPGEATYFKMDDVDDLEMPETLDAAGNGHLAARMLPLDRFGSRALARHLDRVRRAGRSEGQLLAYTPKKHGPGSPSAIASATRVLDRFLEGLRLPTGDITASSITQWRVANVLQAHGVATAHAISGRSTVTQMYRALGSYEPPAQEPDGEGPISFLEAL